MTRVIVAPEARNDLLEIVSYLTVFAGFAVAERWNEKLWKAIEDLYDFPATGSPRPELGEHVRVVVVHPYVVIYEHIPPMERVDILRVLHGRRRQSRDVIK